MTKLWLSIFVSLFLFASLGYTADGTNEETKKAEAGTAAISEAAPSIAELSAPEEEQILKNLVQVTSRILEIRRSLDKLQNNPRGKSGKESEDRRNELQSELSSLVANFESMATRVPEEELPRKNDLKLNWTDAITEITKPLLLAVQEISDKPRKIDLLKAKIQTFENQLKRFQVAESHLLALASNTGLTNTDQKPVSRQVESAFREEIKLLRQKYDPQLIQLKLEETKRNLSEIENSQNSIFQALAITVVEFFRVRGKNLFVSLLTFFAVWGFLNWLFRVLTEMTPLMNKIRSSQRKVISAASSVLFLTTAFFSGLLALYLQNDWLLLSILLLSLVGVAWASRQLIPQCISEIRAVMNLGSIREKERMVWQGVPFLIKEIGFFVTLENPALENCQLHLPVGKILDQHSRPVVKGEKWFPTQKNDWVLLSDGTYGQIRIQTLEQVVIDNLEAEKYYSTTQFLQLNPRNLSEGYTHLVRFGLDYAQQSEITTNIPRLFRQEMLNDLVAKFGGSFKKLVLEFDHAADSSLILAAKVTFSENMGAEYFAVERYINLLLVNACNKHGLTIPFNQLTLSLSPSVQSALSLTTQNTSSIANQNSMPSKH